MATRTTNAEADRVVRLPGAPPLDFEMFSGYVTVDEVARRKLFYIFAAASQVDHATAPVVLWLNGGPGCSSIGGGFMTELGPFLPKPGGRTLQRNAWSFNTIANVIFLDSPAYVGFSTSSDDADRVVGDARTAADARKFLLGWLERFPEYKSSPIYLSGESYGGHYVPNLAWEIVQGSQQALLDQPGSANATTSRLLRHLAAQRRRDVEVPGHINLQGFFVGNAWTDAAIDNLGCLDFWYAHAIISDDTYNGIVAKCDLNVIGPLMQRHADGSVTSQNRSPPFNGCDKYVDAAFKEMGNINIYEIYADVCLADASNAAAKPLRYRGALLGYADPRVLSRGRTREDGNDAYDPCVDDEATAYLNLPGVQAALHVNTSGELPGPWSDCTDKITYSREDLLSSMLPVYRHLLAAADLKIWVYSGDVDGIVPVLGSRRWIHGLGRPVVNAWRPWTSRTRQVAGWRIDYDGITFATVRNAGHMVPYTQPERAFALFEKFLSEPVPPSMVHSGRALH